MSGLCLVLAGCGGRSDDDDGGLTFISIGTGAVTGVYYQVGASLTELLDKAPEAEAIKASFQATGGSVYNINAVMSGDMQFGLCQSDRQYQAVHGMAEWEDAGTQDELRAVCSVHPESVTLLATVESGIRSLSDLPGKRVNIGNPGSGQRGNALEVLNAVGIDWERDLHAESAKASESSKLLQDGRIDAFFYTVGHPAGAFSEATAGRRATRFVPITGVGRLLEQRPYYAPSTVDVSLYPNAENTAEVETIGVMTTLVSSADVPEELVYTVTRVLFENLDRFRSMHPAFARLQAEDMTRLGLSAPLHPGALRYYREAGLLE